MRFPTLIAGFFALAFLGLNVPAGGQSPQDDAGSQAVSPTVEAQTAADAKWLLALDGRPVAQAVSDKRFEPFLAKYFQNTEVKFWSTKTDIKHVPEVAVKYLGGSAAEVRLEHNRYAVMTGCIESFCQDKGLLWVDAHIDADTSQPTLAFAAIDVRAGSAHLWLFSNKDFYDSPFTIPQDLRVSLSNWLSNSKHDAVKHIDKASLVDPTGEQEMEVTPALLGVPLSMINLTHP